MIRMDPFYNESTFGFVVCRIPGFVWNASYFRFNGLSTVTETVVESIGSPRSKATRFLPNVEFAASWWCVASTEEIWRNPWKLAPRAMPRSVYSRWVEGGGWNGNCPNGGPDWMCWVWGESKLRGCVYRNFLFCA